MTLTLVHRVSMPAPATHLVHVETEIASNDGCLADEIVLFMAVWTPGSYLIREYARHVEGFAAEAPARATKIRKNAWLLRTGGCEHASVSYRVYAGELTVRTSHVDASHAFLVGAGLFLGIEGQENLPARLEIEVPQGWRATTSLAPTRGTSGGDKVLSFEAPDFDTLVDSPIELGPHRVERFEAQGKPHRLAVCPASALSETDARKLVSDARTVIETQAMLFGAGLPYDAYELLLHVSTHGRGGLEHRSSAALIVPPSSFDTREAYLDLLSLVAHEVFHAWNVKRIRPAGLTPYRYGEECYTRLLWWFEGGTSYYDWRTLALARLCSAQEYLDHLAAEIAYVEQTPGRLLHALEDASYDAWIKLYRPDENLANSSVSYYRKGEVVCALLDVELRARTSGRATLDRVLAHLWAEFGVPQRPVPEDALQSVFERVAGVPLGDLFDAWIRGTGEIDYAKTLAHVGLSTERVLRPEATGCSLGLRVRAEGGRTIVTSVVRASAAWLAGFDSGDEIVAVGGARVEATNIDGTLRGRAPGETVDVVSVHNGRLVTRSVVLDPPRADRFKIVCTPEASEGARQAFRAWLGQDPPTGAST
jgi:predicted metalloprotease with PDZ domain